MPWPAWRQVAIRTWRESSSDNIGLISAGVAFYGFLAVLPLLAATILSYGIFVEPQTVIRHMQDLTRVLPEAAAIAIGQQLLQLTASPDERKGLGVLISLGIALFGARNGAGAIISALNIAYEEDEKRGFFRLNLTALALTAAAVVGAIAAATALALVAAIDTLMIEVGGFARFITTVLTYGLLALAGAGAATVLYRFGPSRRPARWVWLTPGSLFCTVGWLVLTFGFGSYARYVGKFDSTYGSLGAVVALLTWLYLSSYVLLLGAELNSELEHQTARDTTKGSEQPLGTRGAWVADHVAGAETEPRERLPQRTVPDDRPASPPTPVRAPRRNGNSDWVGRIATAAAAGLTLATLASIVRGPRA
ncbi:YihY/virulence factor BrkB family protein [Sphingomonas turrisvirgatae]|nr:YihY/virulence factor BrkB family protein [Sphingomonas turrisvirgatae]